MATIDLGKIKPVWRGTWAGSTAYEKNDMIAQGVNSYICTAAHTSDASTFGNDSANWDVMAIGADIPSQTGYAGKALVTDGTNMSWGDGGSLLQVVQSSYDGNTASTATNYSWVNTGLEITVTPRSTSSKFLVSVQAFLGRTPTAQHDITTAVDIYDATLGVVMTPYSTQSDSNGNMWHVAGDGWSNYSGTNAQYSIQQVSGSILYTPSSTQSSHTFRFRARGNSYGGWVMNKQDNAGDANRRTYTRSYLTVMEVL